jgi:phage terminase large subunit-like protein
MSDKPQLSYQELIKQEYKKCLESPVYFMKYYAKIQHPIRGTILFDLYKFQEETLQDFHDFKFNIILKSRQMGISTLVAVYSLWLMVFHKDKNILLISLKQDDAKEVITKVRFANDNLPTWLKVKCLEDNRLSLKFANGSQIKAASTTKKSGVGHALSLLIIDECLTFFNTIYVRNKITGEIKSVKIGELYESKEYK